jgi:hypothetical protein
MKRGRGCERIMHELASLQPFDAQNDTVAVVTSRGSPASKPPYLVKRRRWEGLEEKSNGDIAGVEGEARQGRSHASAWEKSENPRCQKEERGRPVRS